MPLKGILTVVLLGALTPSAWAGPLAKSIAREGAKAAAEQSVAEGRASSKEMVAGAALLVSGIVVAFYGFGNPTGPPPDETRPWIYPHRTSLCMAGLGIAAAGAILTWHGVMRPSIQVGPRRLTVQQRIAF